MFVSSKCNLLFKFQALLSFVGLYQKFSAKHSSLQLNLFCLSKTKIIIGVKLRFTGSILQHVPWNIRVILGHNNLGKTIYRRCRCSKACFITFGFLVRRKSRHKAQTCHWGSLHFEKCGEWSRAYFSQRRVRDLVYD